MYYLKRLYQSEFLFQSPKSHKQKLNILEKQFEAEMKEKTSKLKPRVFGCIWISNDVEKDGSKFFLVRTFHQFDLICVNLSFFVIHFSTQRYLISDQAQTRRSISFV